MELADFDAVPSQTRQRFGRLLKFHRQMAGVIIDAKKFRQAVVVWMFGAKQVEEIQRFIRGFQHAEWFRLEAEMQPAACLSADPFDMFNTAENIRANQPKLVVRRNKLLERTRHSAHTPFH